jgi:hypothetical protein
VPIPDINRYFKTPEINQELFGANCKSQRLYDYAMVELSKLSPVFPFLAFLVRAKCIFWLNMNNHSLVVSGLLSLHILILGENIAGT